MSSFFASLNFPRVVILTSLLASAVVGWLDYKRSERLDALQIEVQRAPMLVREIQMNAMELDSLQKIANREGIIGGGVDDVEFYIRKKASAENVNIGQVETSTTTHTPARGVEDRRYKIKPKEKTSRFPRGAIANFLFMLERDSRRVKVTNVKINPAAKVKPGEIGQDAWTFETDITIRQAVEP